jgi:hypothetical protein
MQRVWIVEFSPWNGGTVGGFDWYPEGESSHAYAQFASHLTRIGHSHDIALYTIHLPKSFDHGQIQVWCEDHINCIPLYED